MTTRAAIVFVALLATACSAGGSQPTAGTALLPTTLPLTETVLTPEADFGTRTSGSGYRRFDAAAATAQVGFYSDFSAEEWAGPAIVEFQRPNLPPECVQRAALEFSVQARRSTARPSPCTRLTPPSWPHGKGTLSPESS